ncbi:MAG: chromate resistance protein [Actinomycetota bacterium]|nr:chromate resistance protein [Actinomycetota bacterium]
MPTDVARIVHEADLGDDGYDAPEAPGLHVLMRGLAMIRADQEVLSISAPLYDGLYEYFKRSALLGSQP